MNRLLRRTPNVAAELEAVHERVHGVPRTCADCGAVAACAQASMVTRADFAGEQHLYGRCRTCVGRGPNLDRRVAADLMKMPVDAYVLDAIRVPRFADRPTARPDRPNQRPWQHVDRDALAAQIAAERVALDKLQGGPCCVCGSTVTPRNSRWQDYPFAQRDKLPLCGVCQLWLELPHRGAYTVDGARCLLASVLIGESTPTARVRSLGGVSSFAADLGVVLHCESGRKHGDVRPFAYLDLDAIRARHPNLDLDVGRWLRISKRRLVALP